MAHVKLTEKQTQIINTIKAEFMALNNVEVPSNGLIDINEIVQTIEEERKFEKECELENNIFLKKKYELMLADIRSIEGDLNKLHIEVEYPKSLHCGFYIRPIGVDIKKEHYYNNLIRFEPSHYQERKFNKIERRVFCGYYVGFNTYSSFDNKYKTFKEFINSSEFKDKLKMLYKKGLELNAKK